LHRKPKSLNLYILLGCLTFLFTTLSLSATPLPQVKISNIDDLIARHLDSIGTKDARSNIKNRFAKGALNFTTRIGSPWKQTAKAEMISAGDQLSYTIIWPDPDGLQEEMIFNGKQAKILRKRNYGIEKVSSNAVADLTQFIYRHMLPLKEGLFGGVLSTAWPLLCEDREQFRLQYRGIKKVQDRQLHLVEYRSRKEATDLKVMLYFDPKSFRHLRTEYQYENTEHRIDAKGSALLVEARYALIEEFDDFRVEDGVTLPHKQRIQLVDSSSDQTKLNEWAVVFSEIGHNNQRVDDVFR